VKEPVSTSVLELLAETLESREPPAGVRARLMAAIEGPMRYLPFCADLSRHFELPESRMRELLGCIDAASTWRRGAAPVEGSYNFRPGPALLPLHGGFVRLLGGTGFPMHRHRDRELTYVLSGSIFDHAGHHYAPGSVIEMAPGSVHSLSVTDEAPALLAVLSGAIEMLGE
jgi:Cupin domain